MRHDAADDCGGGDVQQGVTVVGTEQGGGRRGAPRTLPHPHQGGSAHRHWRGVLGTSGEWGGEGCGSSHPEALWAALWQGPVQWGGDGEANDETVWRDDHVGAWLGGCVGAALG